MILSALGCGTSPTQLWLQECPCNLIYYKPTTSTHYAKLFKEYVKNCPHCAKSLIETYSRFYHVKPKQIVRQSKGPCVGLSYALAEVLSEHDYFPRELIHNKKLMQKAFFYSLYDIVRAKGEEDERFKIESLPVKKETYKVDTNGSQFLNIIQQNLASKVNSVFVLRFWQSLKPLEMMQHPTAKWASPHAICMSLKTDSVSLFYDSSLDVLLFSDNSQILIEAFIAYIKTLRKEYISKGVLWRFETRQ